MHVLFDLDGTLTDPREGILNGLKYALESLGAPIPSDTALERYIGPPLQANFAALLETTDPTRIATAVHLYRQRYTAGGMFQNVVYPGITQTLTALQAQRVALYVATAKPTVQARQILEHFGLSHYFQAIYGSELDGTRTDKRDLIAYILADTAISPQQTVMVGDREYDMRGAVANRVTPVGVLWGYGSQQELTSAGASLLCDSPPALGEVLAAHFQSR